MARFAIQRTNGRTARLDDLDTGEIAFLSDSDAIELRDLLLSEFPVEDAPECGVDFHNAEGRLWACELPKGHEWRHAAPSMNEIQHLPPPPATSRKERRERIATAVLAGFAACPTSSLPEESTTLEHVAVRWADALIAALDEEA